MRRTLLGPLLLNGQQVIVLSWRRRWPRWRRRCRRRQRRNRCFLVRTLALAFNVSALFFLLIVDF